jgi:hypothetical protein
MVDHEGMLLKCEKNGAAGPPRLHFAGSFYFTALTM